MEALKAIKIIGNQNDGRAVFLFLPNTGRVTKGFKFHARPQTGAYSCYCTIPSYLYRYQPTLYGTPVLYYVHIDVSVALLS